MKITTKFTKAHSHKPDNKTWDHLLRAERVDARHIAVLANQLRAVLALAILHRGRDGDDLPVLNHELLAATTAPALLALLTG